MNNELNIFAGKTLLITGGTGSFGNAVLKRFLGTDIKEIRIFSRDEKKQEDMRIALQNPKVNFYIGDVRNFDSVNTAMVGVDYVFHAAALKQVPSCEFYPMEAVQTNVIGAENVLNASLANDVKKAIFLSTDKAVYPINAMGMSKSLMEKVMVAKSRLTPGDKTVFCGTRYGNVMASRGSVIPLFIQQILENKPITVTDPNMTRFMMSLDDAVDLVLWAYEHGNHGDRFIQKAPATTISTLAKALISIFRSSTDLRVIGTRHGEKLHETLLTREEKAIAEDMGGYFRVPADNRDLNYNKYFVEGEDQITSAEDYSSDNTERLDVEGTVKLLMSLDYVQKEVASYNSPAGLTEN
jgi:UDP-N-acetylglucosamine 4,6-dehydratase/5-epimerase